MVFDVDVSESALPRISAFAESVYFFEPNTVFAVEESASVPRTAEAEPAASNAEVG